MTLTTQTGEDCRGRLAPKEGPGKGEGRRAGGSGGEVENQENQIHCVDAKTDIGPHVGPARPSKPNVQRAAARYPDTDELHVRVCGGQAACPPLARECPRARSSES